MAAIASAADFVDLLRCWGLLEPSQLSELSQRDATQADPRPLARRLIQQGLLTPYQINHVLSGRGQELVLGSYLLLERLGAGGMGEVFKARHQRLGRTVALKAIRRDRIADREAICRFRREIQAVAQLSHPNIVLAFDADEVGDTIFFVMEYVDGVNLKDHVHRSGPLPPAEACDYIRQAALGLDHIAEHGLVHRDIKPSNLLLRMADSSGRHEGDSGVHHPAAVVKIADLGLARLRLAHAGDDGSVTLTRNGVLMGTPDFIATEQAATPHAADIRSDLYSLGCTFYFLLTGRVPFPGGSAVEKLFRHRGEEPEPVERLSPEVSRKVAGIVRKLMAKRPQDRFQTPGEAAHALAPFADPKTASVRFRANHATLRDLAAAGATASDAVFGADPDSPQAAGLGKGGRPRRTWWVLGVAGLILAAGIGLGFGLMQGDAGEPPATASVPVSSTVPALPERHYVRKATRRETILATLKANQLPTLEGKWHVIGPFELFHNGQTKGFREAFPPETEIDLGKTYKGKGDQPVAWKEFKSFRLGEIVDLRIFKDHDGTVAYLHHEFDALEPAELPLSLGSDDTLTVWLNGKQLMAREGHHGASPDQERVTLSVRPGKNQLLLKICNYNGAWAVYAMPQWPTALEAAFGASLRRDFLPKPR